MRKIAVLSLFLCLVAVCRAQYIGSQYMNVKLGYIVDESQVQGTFGTRLSRWGQTLITGI